MVYGAPGSNLANRSVLNLSFLDSGDKVLHQGIQTYGWINLNFIGFVMFFKNIRCKSLPLLFFNIWFPLQIVLKSINFV
ncbi:Inactive purple acid phosphatase-like protein [Quillaja saponaria]|uniref:Inactive purple acid phosphatase-like protein n=1 Tax=Quillaja saponaria TaxID=32244 RepID=A0AAD7QEH8_QUISA|nr:Inactive purple acid phosphatase-like protein [Quillaja saponaria]